MQVLKYRIILAQGSNIWFIEKKKDVFILYLKKDEWSIKNSADNLHVSYGNLTDEKTAQSKTRVKNSIAEEVFRATKSAHTLSQYAKSVRWSELFYQYWIMRIRPTVIRLTKKT